MIGGLTTGMTSWLNQRSLARAGQLAHEMSRRQELYKDFILAAVFFATSLGLTYFSAPAKTSGVIQHLDAPASTPGAGNNKTDVNPAAPASSAPAPAGSPAEKSPEVPK